MALKSSNAARPATPGRPVIRDKAIIAAAEEYVGNQAEEKRLEVRQQQLKQQLLTAMGESDSIVVGNRILTRTQVAALPSTPNMVVSREMIGQVIPGKRGRSGYVMLSVQ